ncbi:hypothetical protein HYG81_20915 (plasmid) [Natrinema zhouii]|uniref:hypothetical protein n=1 Tax=Natrinema zhouii TaxID=1710539 RepID=UPI001CFF94DD|nr:hypothetical protein [Natrinema zhouii]UHQ98073.1 hypothetical protein HYG81_20915 [Natrinema zhouii]
MVGQEGADWKNQPQNLLNGVVIVLALVVVLMYVYRGVTLERTIYLGFATIFFLLFVAYLSSYWQPILYLVGVLVLGTFSTVLILVRFWDDPFDWVILTANVILIGLDLYLFLQEEIV